MLSNTLLLLGALAQAHGGPSQPEFAAPASASAPSRASAPAASHDGSARQLEVVVPQGASASVRIDGRLDEAAWAGAPVLHGFTQYDPVEGVPASQRTEARVLLTDDAIYFAVEAFDDTEGGVRATLAKRDGFGRTDDYVRFILDTFDDQRRAFVFQVNPLGVQADGLWVEGQGGGWGDPIDWNPDFLWESAGTVGTDRYVVEVKVPLKSLRFPALPVQDWGFQVQRTIQRNGFGSSWAPRSSGVANQLAQAGKITGLRDLDPGLFMEVNPVLTGSRVGAWDGGRDAFQRGPASGDFGLNVTYGLTSNLTLDATYNPDFSQVEADAGQITVNERFAVRLPEKRPFFLEGTDIFNLPAQLVYTRSIGSPVGAAKLSGKVGSFSVAYLGAVDQVGEDMDHPVVNLVRVKRDMGRSSTLGAVYTDRTQPGASFNRVLGADGRLVLGGRYTVDVLAAGSADGASGEETDWGSFFLAKFDRSGRNLSLNGSFEDIGESFRAGSGFIRRVGVTQVDGRTGYTWRGGRGALVENWGPEVQVQGTWNRDDFWAGRGPEEAEVQLEMSASFRGNVRGSISFERKTFDVAPGEYEGLHVAGVTEGDATPFAPSPALFGGLNSVRARAGISSWERVRLSFGASWGEAAVFERWRGLPADVANSVGGDVNVSLYPTGSLSTSLGIRHSVLRRKRDGSTYSTATIPRVQAQYQFSRSLFARVISEYAVQERGEVLDPETGRSLVRCDEGSCTGAEGSDRYDFSLEGLLGFEPSPGTVVFVGYARQMRDAGGFRFQDVTTRSDGLFVKLSYRFRM
ncbi:MAG TPA: DUF5916 domain-containing protein [Longimicrobiales bacterium]|nr:DUF5916 domain-containing protein [Longimicrobiales bacterium]